MKWYPNYIGYLDGEPNRRVYVRIELTHRNGPLELAISGEARDGSCGQINMHIHPDNITPAKGRTVAEIWRLWAIWKRWHLNTMRAGCEHQTANPYLMWRIGEPCPVCEYRYGHEWIAEPLPDDVVEWLTEHFTVTQM